jgi:hypothetical protein
MLYVTMSGLEWGVTYLQDRYFGDGGGSGWWRRWGGRNEERWYAGCGCDDGYYQHGFGDGAKEGVYQGCELLWLLAMQS